MWLFRAVSIGALSILATHGQLKADIFRLTYSGNVTAVSTGVSGMFSPGQTVEGAIFFDTSITARAGSNADFAFFDSILRHDYRFFDGVTPVYSASLPLTPGGLREIQVDNAPGAANDRLGLVSNAADGLAGSSVNGFALQSMGLRFDDTNNDVFNSALDHPRDLQLSDFTSGTFFMFLGNFDQSVIGTINAMESSAIPEPVNPFLWGLMATAWIKKRRRRLR